MSERLLRLPEVEHLTGRRKSWLYEQIADQKFPAPIKLGRSSLWSLTSVEVWVSNTIKAGQQAA